MSTTSFYGFPPNSKEEWLQQVKKDLKGKDFELTLESRLWEEIKISPMYFSEDVKFSQEAMTFHPEPTIEGFPARVWQNVVSIFPNDPKAANKEILDVLNQGAEGLVLHLNGSEDLSLLLDHVLTEYISIYFLPEANPDLVFEGLVKYLSANPSAKDSISGGFLWSPTQELTSKDALPNWELGSQLINFFADYLYFKPLTIDFGRYADAGGSGIQELTFGFSELIENLAGLTETGLSPELIFDNMAYCSSVGEMHFPEIAKLKALRKLIVELAMTYGLTLALEDVVLLVASSSFTKSLLDRETNLIRQTYEAMSGILGGANSIWIRPVLGAASSKLEKRMARNTTTILREESYLDKVMDPASGSYYLENIQKSIERSVTVKVKAIASANGWLAAIQGGEITKLIKERRIKIQTEVLENQRSKVGVNRYIKSEVEDLTESDFRIVEVENQLLPSRASYLVELQNLKKS